MSADSILQTHAEVSVALAGFASVAAVLRRPLSPRDRQRFLAILFCALVQLLGSLVPVWLPALGVAGPILWQIATALVLVLSLTVVVMVYVQVRAIGAHTRLLNSSVTFISRVLSAGSIGALLLNLFGFPTTPGFGLYYASLLLGLTVVFLIFADVVVSEDPETT